MRNEEFLNKLLGIYRSSFNIEKPFVFQQEKYDAYGFCDITNAKYVLVKKAELWRAICYEHAFFRMVDELKAGDIERFTEQTVNEIEPKLVRKGEKCMEKDHMYSYITGIFLCEKGISPEVQKKIKKAHFYKNYRLSLRGYCEMRILAVDLENNKLIGNGAARDLRKDYKRFI